jgi:hypothetical protein
MKDKMILRILAQESLKSELWLQRYGDKSFRDLFGISGKWLGPYLEIFLDSRGFVWNFMDCGIICNKGRGSFANMVGFPGFGFLFSIENCMDRVHGLWTVQGMAGPRFHRGLHSGRQPMLHRSSA